MRGVGESGRSVVALGNFDGVHLGHRAVVGRAAEEARGRGWRCVVATFDPHPREVLRPGEGPQLLTPLEVRRELLLEAGADEVVAVPFTRELSRKSPEEFVRDVLVGSLRAGLVVVGENFRFGYKAAGDFGELRRRMEEAGGGAIAVPITESDGGISSTAIRRLVAEGRTREVARLLGRPYSVRGPVVRGDARGRKLGYPTANVLPDERQLVPGYGIYAGRVRVGGEWFGAAISVGVAPTFERRDGRIEAYLLDFDRDIYGEVVDVEFVEYLRGEEKFDGVEALVEQMGRDVEAARTVLAAGAS